MSARLVRASGAGNTFYIADLFVDRQTSLAQIPVANRSAFVREICASLGPVTDGLFFIEAPDAPATDFRWDFYNADGSSAEMCGNAARCVTIYYFQKTKKANIDFSTRAGTIHAESIANDQAKVKMSRMKGPFEKSVLMKDGRRISGYGVDTGVPHFVTRELLSKAMGKEIREHKEFGKAGTNVTQIQKQNGANIEARTYERGVEDFTQACGTGAVAAASVIWLEKSQSPIGVKMPGGLLKVYFSHDSPHPILEGPVVIEEAYDVSKELIERFL